jgi:hypothetical protein
MKKKVMTVLFLIMVFGISSIIIGGCCSKNRNQRNVSSEARTEMPDRIKVITTTLIRPARYTITIVEIDGHLYASQSQGALTHLESCNCKKH